METDATRMCALLVGLPHVIVHAVGEWPSWLLIVITTVASTTPATCDCGARAHRHGVSEVDLVDLPVEIHEALAIEFAVEAATVDGSDSRRVRGSGPTVFVASPHEFLIELLNL